MKKYSKFIFALLILFLSSTVCFADTSISKDSATLTVVEDTVSTVTFGKYGELEKKIEKVDAKQNTIDIRLTVKNNQEPLEEKAGNMILLIDSSASMEKNKVTIDGVITSRKDLVIKSAKQLVEKIVATNENMQIGIVGFSTSKIKEEEGTEKDAIIYTDTLTNDVNTLTQAIDDLAHTETGIRTDIEVGLNTAEQLLDTSTDTSASKYIVVLTDAVPNTALGVTYDYYTEASATPTREKLLALKDRGINMISMLISISDDEINIYGRPADATFKTYKDVANYVFGTNLAPTAGVVYYIEDEEIIDTVTETIYKDLVPDGIYGLTDIVIKDYLSRSILDNFDFSLLTRPTIGQVTDTINPSDNSITWTIPRLKPKETATFAYRLSLKSQFSSDIVGQNLPTNEKDITVDYKENGTAGHNEQKGKSSAFALDVQAPSDKPLPQTGSNTFLIVGLVGIAGVMAIISFISFKNNSLK